MEELNTEFIGCLVDQIHCLEKVVFVTCHHLDGHVGRLSHVHSDVPAHDAELHRILLADVNAIIETPRVKQVSGQAHVHH